MGWRPNTKSPQNASFTYGSQCECECECGEGYKKLELSVTHKIVMN